MKKILFVTPHLSTGGLPQYLYKKIESFINEYEIWCIEHSNYSDEYVVQKNKIRNLLGSKLITLGEDKRELLSHISNIEPDVIHFEEVPEDFLTTDILDEIYKDDRTWSILATTHSSNTNPRHLRYLADKFVLVSEWSCNVFKSAFGDTIPCEIWEYPIVVRQDIDRDFYKKKLGFEEGFIHVLNVGLFTQGKNQGEIFEIARKLKGTRLKFHFVGNLAPNFEPYWGSIISNKPENCIIHGERFDVEDFYSACDAFYFSSNFELNPLVIKEALSFNLPVFAKKLPTYLNSYDGLIHYITGDVNNDIKVLLNNLSVPKLRACHLLIDVNSDREIISIDSMSKISNKVEYIQCINKRYKGEDWKNQTPISGWAAHGSGHWGAFQSFKSAIKNYLTEDISGLLIFEADCVLDVSVDEFLNTVDKALVFCNKHKLPIFSFGPRYLDGVLQSDIIQTDEDFPDFVMTNKFIQAHCILLTHHCKDYLFEMLQNHWDSPDIFFNEIYLRSGQNLGIMLDSISHQEEGVSMIDNIQKGEKSKKIFDYVEIGTSNFDTLVQVLDDTKRGLSIEPVKYYLDELPNKDNNTKLNLAVSNITNKDKIFLVDAEDITRNSLPEWIMGCNSISTPHPTVISYLNQNNLSHIYKSYDIDIISFEELVDNYDIGAIKYLKVDTEGHDFVILRNLLKTNLRPRKIRFEANSLYRESDILRMIEELQQHGYKLIQRTFNNVIVKYEDQRFSYKPINKPILVISTGRRLNYFKRTLESLFSKNSDINNLFKRVWILDDRSSSEDRVEMENIMKLRFGDKFNTVYFNSNEKFYFVEKFNFIKKISDKEDVIFFLEDDWECHDEIHLNYHLYNLLNSDYTQIAFSDSLGIQEEDVINQNLINLDYWNNPFPKSYRHVSKWWDGDVCLWNTVTLNNYTNSPSLVKASVFHSEEFNHTKNFESEFASAGKLNLIFTQECLFRHIGDESLIDKL